jgi:hypothetical protein
MAKYKLTTEDSVKGGKVKSEKKTNTARENGKKGGRPKKINE